MSMDRAPYPQVDIDPTLPAPYLAVISVRPGWRVRFFRTFRRITRSLPFHLLLFGLTAFTTLLVGAHMSLNYAHGVPVFDFDLSGAFFWEILRHPAGLLQGVPFSFTLLTILLAHEMGHYLTCRHYRIRATYPYFIPAPTLIGTMGAFIRIESPIWTREALFDVGVSGPLAGFVLAIPALAWGVVQSKLLPAGALPGAGDPISLGNPLALSLLERFLRPGIGPADLLLSPVACAAWVGLFATSLNLLPMGQLDGGHIVFAVFGRGHRLVSRIAFLGLVPLGILGWKGWLVWAALLLLLGLRHPDLMAPAEPLGGGRKLLAAAAAAMLVLCFVPVPFAVG